MATTKSQPTRQAIAQDIAALVSAKSGVKVAPSVVLEHFKAEGTGYANLGGNGIGGYNLAGIQSGGGTAFYSSAQAFEHEYVATVTADLKGALANGLVQKGQSLTSGQYAAALQYGVAGQAYCGGSDPSSCNYSKGNRTFYGVYPTGQALPPTVASDHGGAKPITGSAVLWQEFLNASNPQNASSGAGGKNAGGAQGSLGGVVAGAANTQGSWLSQLETWVTSSAERVGLVLLFAVLAIVVFVYLLRSQIVGAARSFAGA